MPPLALPDPGQRLPPLERARAVRGGRASSSSAPGRSGPDFALTERERRRRSPRSARRLDGLPLAIELAAARIEAARRPRRCWPAWSSRLALLTGGARDLPARQQTLRGAIAWSYDLLARDGAGALPPAGRLRRRLDLEAAEAVVGDREAAGRRRPRRAGVAGRPGACCARRTGAGDEPRFAMLETIREYAPERLAERGEAAALRRRHAAYFLALAEEAAPQLRGPAQVAWLDRLEREHDNLRAALAWAAAREGTEEALRLAGALGLFWLRRSHLGEGRRWLEAALAGGAGAARARGRGRSPWPASSPCSRATSLGLARCSMRAWRCRRPRRTPGSGPSPWAGGAA